MQIHSESLTEYRFGYAARSGWFLVFLLLFTLGTPGLLSAQNDAQTRKFTLAETYIRAGQYDRAISILEDLYHDQPETFVFYDKLKSAYVALKRYEDAIRLVDDQLARVSTPALMAEKGSLLYQLGDEQAAYSIWDEAIEMAPHSEVTYRSVYFALSNNRLFDRAIEMLTQARITLDNENLFQIDMAYLYGLVGNHEQSMQEYLGILEEAPQQLQFVKRRFGQFSAQDNAVTSSIPVVERAIRQEPLNRTFRELAAWLYLKAGDYDQALDANRAIDRLEKEDGRILLAFARDATQAEAFDAAAAAYEEILERYPDAPTSASAQFLLARLNAQIGESLNERAFDANGNRIPAPHFDYALESYRSFTQKYPFDPRVPDALLQIGRLQMDTFFDLGAAETLLTDVINRYPETDAGFQARFDLGKIALMRSDLRRARVLFSRLEDELRIGELAELARFEMAQIDFYTGQFESALTLVQALDANTSTDIANDAIELKILLRENKGPDSLNTPLRYYATAQLLHRQRQHQSALANLDTLSTRYAGHALSDETLFLRAEILRATGATAQVLATLNQLVETHPESYLADRSLFLTGELYEQELDDPSGALEAYTNLLTTFPGSLLAPEARARIRALRGDGV